MATTVSTKTLTTAIGALTGGMISDDDGYGTILGAATGAVVGHNFTVIKPNKKDFYSYKSELNVEKPLTDFEKYKQHMTEKISTTRKAADFSEGPLPFENLRKTKDYMLNEVENAKTLDELKELDMFYKNGFKEIRKLDDIRGLVATNSGLRNVNILSKSSSSVNSKVTALQEAYKRLGFEEKEALEKAENYKDLFEKHAEFSLDNNSNTLKIGGTELKLTGKFKDKNGTEFYSHANGNNFYSVKTANIFGDEIAKAKFSEGGVNELNVGRITEALGIKPPEAGEAPSSAYSFVENNLQKWAKHGMLPEDLTALKMMSPDLKISNDEIKEIANSMHILGEYESGLIKSGMSQGQVSHEASGLASRLGTFFDLNQTLDVDKKVIKQINSRRSVQGSSTLDEAFKGIQVLTGYNSLRMDVKADKYTEGNRVERNLNSVNAMTAGERNPSISSSRGVKVRLKDGQGTNLAKTFESLKAQGKVGQGYETAIIGRRKSVDESSFNSAIASKIEEAEAALFNYDPTDPTSPVPKITIGGKEYRVNGEFVTNLESLAAGDGSMVVGSSDFKQYTHDLTVGRTLSKTEGNFRVSAGIEKFLNIRSLTGINSSTSEFNIKDLMSLSRDADKLKNRVYGSKTEKALGLNYQQFVEAAKHDNFLDFIASDAFTDDQRLIINSNKKLKGTLGKVHNNLKKLDARTLGVKQQINDIRTQLKTNNPKADLSYLDKLEQSIDQNILDPGKIALNEASAHNNAVKLKVRSNEIIGYDESGEVRAPRNISGNMHLTDVTQSNQSDKLEFVFKGNSNLGKEGDTLKTFGDNTKQNSRFVKTELVDIANALADDIAVDSLGDGVFKAGRVDTLSDIGTSAQKEAFKFVKHFRNSHVADQLEAINNDTSLSASEKVTAKRGLLESGTTVVDPATGDPKTHGGLGRHVNQEVSNNLHNKAEEILSRVSNVKKAGGDVVRAQAVADRELWALSQLNNALGDTKASSTSVEGMFVGASEQLYNFQKDIQEKENTISGNTKADYVKDLRKNEPGLTSVEIDKRYNSHLKFNKKLRNDKLDLYSKHFGIDLSHTDSSGNIVKFGEAGFDMDQVKSGDFFKEVHNKLYDYKESFRADNISKAASSGKLFDDFMFNMYQLAYDKVGIDYFISSPDYHPTFSTGSGNSVGMSHFAQTQLHGQGFTHGMLNLYGSHDVGHLYDMKGMSDSVANVVKGGKAGVGEIDYEATLNHFFEKEFSDKDGKIIKNDVDNFLKGLSSQRPEEIDDFIRKRIVKGTEQDYEKLLNSNFLYYNLENTNLEGSHSTGIKNVAVYKRNTTLGGHVQIHDGKMTSSKLDRANIKAIRADIEFGTASDLVDKKGVSQRTRAEKNLVGAVNDIADIYFTTLGSFNNPKLKSVATLQGKNSGYLKAELSNNAGFIKRAIAAAEEGREVKGISRALAYDMLKQQGHDLNHIDEVSDFIKDGVLQIDRGHSAAMPMVTGREPSQGPFSFAATEAYVLDDPNLSKTSIYGLSSALKDENGNPLKAALFDKVFKFEDQDNDHLMSFAPESAMTTEQAEAIWDTARKQRDYKDLSLVVAESLGVKNKGATGEDELKRADKSIFDLQAEVEENAERYGLTEDDLINKTDNYHSAVQKRVTQYSEEGANKRALRKMVSPGVTVLAMDLQENVNSLLSTDRGLKLLGNQNKDDVLNTARTISHYLTENLLKSTHSETSGGISEIEKLLDLRFSYLSEGNASPKREKYFEALDNMLEDAVSSFMENPDKAAHHEVVDKAVELLKVGEKDLTSRSNITNVLAANTEIRRLMREHKKSIEAGKILGDVDFDNSFGNLMEGLNNLFAGATHNNTTSLIDTVEVERSKTPNLKLSGRAIKKNVMDNLEHNSKGLMIGAGVLALGALMTQSDPNFQPKQSARAEPQSMTLAPQAMSSGNDSAMFDALQAPSTGLILPEVDMSRYSNQSYEVYGQHVDQNKQMTNSINQAIFGDNIQSVRIEGAS